MTSSVSDLKRHSPLAIGATILIGMICSLVGNTMPAFIAVLSRTRSLTEGQGGLCAAAYTIGAAVATLGCALMPSVVRRLKWRGTVSLGMAIMITANVFGATAGAFLSTFASLAFVGLGCGMAMAIVYATLAEGNAARQLGIVIVAQLSAGAVAIQFLTPLTNQYGSNGLFSVLAGLGVLVLVLTRLSPRRSIRDAPVKVLDEPPSRTVSAEGWLGVCSVVLFFFSVGGIFAYLEYMGIAWGGSSTHVERDLSLILLAGIAGSALATAVSSRPGVTLPLVGGYALLLGALATYLLAKPLVLFLLVGVVFFFALTFIMPFQFQVVTKIDQTSSAAMLVNAGMYLGNAAGPAVCGYLVTADFRLLSAVCLGCCALSMLLLFTAITRHRRRAPA